MNIEVNPSIIKKYVLICSIIMILTSCVGVGDFVSRDISIEIVSKTENIIFYQPDSLPNKLSNYIVPEQDLELLSNFNSKSSLLNFRYFQLSNDDKIKNLYLKGFRRGGLFWIIPPLGMKGDHSTSFYIKRNHEILLFRTFWDSESVEIYSVENDGVLKLVKLSNIISIKNIMYKNVENANDDDIVRQDIVDTFTIIFND